MCSQTSTEASLLLVTSAFIPLLMSLILEIRANDSACTLEVPQVMVASDIGDMTLETLKKEIKLLA